MIYIWALLASLMVMTEANWESFGSDLSTVAGPRYVGHALAVPRLGDYFTLPQEKGGRTLVRNAHGGLELISNVCCHRQAIMLKGRGNLREQGQAHAGGNIVCPIHRWTYSPSGQLLGAPHFPQDPQYAGYETII